MARAFDDASSQYLEFAGAILSAYPMTMACWFISDDLTINQDLMAVMNTSSTSSGAELLITGAVAGDPLRARGAGTGGSDASGSVLANTWHHGCGVFATSTSRTAYLDGVAGAEDTTSRAFSANRTSLGRRPVGTGLHLSGRMAEAAIWNVALNAREVAALAVGVCPLRVRPGSLVGYWPLWGTHTNEPDLHPESADATRREMTNNGTTAANHAPVMPFSRRIWLPNPGVEVSAGVTSSPFFFNRYVVSRGKA